LFSLFARKNVCYYSTAAAAAAAAAVTAIIIPHNNEGKLKQAKLGQCLTY
jgi:hypothetical protein